MESHDRDIMSCTRRQAIGAALVSGFLIGPAANAQGSMPVVETHLGRVRGRHEGNSAVFRGIRYAVAERFMPPREPVPWAGVAEATSFGASAPQSNANPPPGPPYVILSQLPRPQNAPPRPPSPGESEDCLFLNIWTSGLRDGRKRPVMVTLHGGFFYGGSGSGIDGAGLAARGDVVVVSLNHRLNAFGFSYLDHLGGDEYAHAGNAGMLDIIAALKWINTNIEAFGGDPDRVMVFGTSGGGMKTTFLTASPQSAGLLHRAGVQSGPALRFMEPERAAAATDRLLANLEIAPRDFAKLRTIPVERLLAGYHATAAQLPPENFTDLSCFAPVLDPIYLPHHPFDPGAAPATTTIPMLIGSTGQEMTFFMGNDPEAFELDAERLEERVDDIYGERSKSVVALYRDIYPTKNPSQLFIQIFSDYSVMLPTIRQAERKAAAGGADAWLYRLDFASPALGGKLGALHTIEGPLIFDRVESARELLGEGAAPSLLAKKMSEAWVSFAATGDPNSAANGLPNWPAYDLRDRPTMLFDNNCRLVNDPVVAVRTLLQS